VNRVRSTESPFTTPPSAETSIRKRPNFLNRFRSTETSLSSSSTTATIIDDIDHPVRFL
jgi:hypothetical protein